MSRSIIIGARNVFQCKSVCSFPSHFVLAPVFRIGCYREITDEHLDWILEVQRIVAAVPDLDLEDFICRRPLCQSS